MKLENGNKNLKLEIRNWGKRRNLISNFHFPISRGKTIKMNQPSIRIIILAFILISQPVFALDVPFKVGEKFVYEVTLFGIKIGTQTNEIMAVEKINDQQTYHLRSIINSSAFFSKFYYISKQIDAWVGISNLLPVKLIKDTKLKKKHKGYVFLVDQTNQKATITSKYGKTTKQINLFPNTLDSLSLIYYLRNQDLKVGNSYDLSILSKSEVKQVKVNIVKEEKISTSSGQLITLKAEQSDSDIIVWFSKDKLHIPVKIEVSTEAGRLKVYLCNKLENF